MPINIPASEIHNHLPKQDDVFVRHPGGALAFSCTPRQAIVLADHTTVQAILSHKGIFRYLELIVPLARARRLLRTTTRVSISAADNKTVSRIPTKSGFFYFEHNSRSYGYAMATRSGIF